MKNASEIFRLTDKNRAYLKKTLPWLDGTTKVEDTEKFITDSLQKQSEGKQAIFEIWYQNVLVGLVDFHEISESRKSALIGYWLDEEYQGKGVMTEATKLLVKYGFDTLGLNRIEINCSTENPKSGVVAKRLGFTKEGVSRQAALLYGKFEDLEVWSLLRSEFTY